MAKEAEMSFFDVSEVLAESVSQFSVCRALEFPQFQRPASDTDSDTDGDSQGVCHRNRSLQRWPIYYWKWNMVVTCSSAMALQRLALTLALLYSTAEPSQGIELAVAQPCLAVGNVSALRTALRTESVLREIDWRICMGKWVRRALLHEAALRGQLESTKLLLDKGARVDVEDGDGWTPLATATNEGFLATAQLLLANFADVDHRAFNGQTALMRASRRGSLKTCEWLLANGASLDKKDIYGNSALLLAAQEGHLQVVDLLLSKGMSIEETDQNGWTALVWATKTGHQALAQHLLERGASVRHLDHESNSPLLWPLISGNLPMVKLLLDYGADVYRLRADGLPPYLASGSQEVNDFMLRSRWTAFFMNPLVALSFFGGCLVGALAAYVQLNHSRFLVAPAYDLITGSPKEEQLAQVKSHSSASARDHSPARSRAESGTSMSSVFSEVPDEASAETWKEYLEYLWPQFYHGAFLNAAESQSSLLFYGQIVELEATAVMFCFGLLVVRWILWLPLHFVLFVVPCVQHWRLQVLQEPALLVAKLPSLPGILLMMRCIFLWGLLFLVARPSSCNWPSYSWAKLLCSRSSSFQWLQDPQWPELLMKQMTWRRQHVSSLTGFIFLSLGVSFFAYLVSLAEHTYQPKKRLSIEVQRLLSARHGGAPPPPQHARSCSVLGVCSAETQHFQQQLRVQVLFLVVDTALHVNTVFVLLWTGYFVLAFLLAAVIARSVSLQFLLGRLQQLPEAIRESERYGMFRKDLLQIMAEQRGFQAFLALCLTSYSYWYCVENGYHAFTLCSSLVLSTHNVAEHLHQRVDFDMDLERTPAPETPKVTSSQPSVAKYDRDCPGWVDMVDLTAGVATSARQC
eukprot:s1550_g12.t1